MRCWMQVDYFILSIYKSVPQIKCLGNLNDRYREISRLVSEQLWYLAWLDSYPDFIWKIRGSRIEWVLFWNRILQQLLQSLSTFCFLIVFWCQKNKSSLEAFFFVPWLLYCRDLSTYILRLLLMYLKGLDWERFCLPGAVKKIAWGRGLLEETEIGRSHDTKVVAVALHE